MKTLLTGGAGFIGSRLLERLLTRGDDVVVVDNLDPSYSLEQKRENLSRAQRKGAFQFEERDLRTGVEDLLPVDRIIHLATYYEKVSSPEEAFLCHDINVNASLLLYEAARKTKTPRILLGSSS
ncbi:uncharacterized protein METZ01_LOCUS327119, partial [marine metagenome]